MKISCVFVCFVSSFFFATLVHSQESGSVTQLRRSLFLNLDDNPGLNAGDVVVLKGQFHRGIAQIRFISRMSACRGGGIPGSGNTQCHPLVVRFYPREQKAKIFYKGKIGRVEDVEIASVFSNLIQANQAYTLLIIVGEQNFTLVMNDQILATVNDTIGSEEIVKLRSYGGYFTNFFVQPAVTHTPVTCGMRPGLTEARFRIVGGTNARAGEFPWQASLRFKRTSSSGQNRHLCGATIINSCWVITAAHCVLLGRMYWSNYVIRVGDYYNKDGNNFSSFEEEQEFDIADIVMHSQYRLTPSIRHDIALIRLKSNTSTCVEYSDFVQPICLPSPTDDFPPMSSCSISGWGATRHNDRAENLARILQKGNVKIQEHQDCQRRHGKGTDNEYRVANETVCAFEREVDSCQGDSGGPFSCPRGGNERGPQVLWGITSWGDDCAHPEKPGVYTKVSDYLDWIEEVITN